MSNNGMVFIFKRMRCFLLDPGSQVFSESLYKPYLGLQKPGLGEPVSFPFLEGTQQDFS